METLLKYLKIVVKYRKMVIYNVIILTLVALAISFVLPKKYKATAQILPPTEEPDLLGLSSMLNTGTSTSNLSRLARAGGLFRSSTSSDLIAAILQSRTVREQVISECNIMKEYKIKKSLEKALKLLKRITQIWVSDEGVIQVNIVAKNPNLAAQIANTYLTTVDKFLKESNMSRGHNMRVFIEKRLATAESDLKQASDSLKVFQERNKVISLDDETKAVIDAYAQLKSELLKREIELGVNENTSTQDNPYVLSIKREIEEFKNKLQNIETGKKTEEGFGVGFAVPFKNLPALAAEYAQRLGDFKVQEQIYALLIQQYEQAKVLEARDTPNITILDYAKVPEKKDSPKKIKIVLNVFILTLLLSILLTFIVEYWNRGKESQSQDYKSWHEIFIAFQLDLNKIKQKLKLRS